MNYETGNNTENNFLELMTLASVKDFVATNVRNSRMEHK